MKAKLTGTILTACGLLTAAGLALSPTPASGAGLEGLGGEGPGVEMANLPAEITLVGIVRDFRERTEPNGHPDFERRPASGFGHYMGNIADYLDEDGKPVFTGEGRKVGKQWTDSQNRPMHPKFYDPDRGDRAGSWGSEDPGGIESESTFRQWFRTTPGVNIAKELPITLRLDESSGLYVFDDRQDEEFFSKGGFFPINDDLYGNSAGDNKNFHFTYELSTVFTYEPGAGQTFTFIGDDDVWVFINGELVIDIGGVHAAIRQTVQLDRLENLRPGEENTLHFFFAERHRTQSNFRIETTLHLRTAELPNSAHLYD